MQVLSIGSRASKTTKACRLCFINLAALGLGGHGPAVGALTCVDLATERRQSFQSP